MICVRRTTIVQRSPPRKEPIKTNELVFLEPNKIGAEPFTTSDVIAECAGIQHHTVTRLIQQHVRDFEEFGSLRFEIEVRKRKIGATTVKHYHLNEEQATLLLTYLKNTEAVREFKKNLVRQFYAMRSELMKRQMLRTELKPIRREMTDVIQEVDNSKWAYKKYTDLAYKMATGKTAAQLRKERGAQPKAIAIEYMTSAEIAAVSKLQNQIGVLLEMGMDYAQVKTMLLNRRLIDKPA